MLGGLGTAMASRALANAPTLDARPPHHKPKARSVIFLFMMGGPSHMDLFDPKPVLNKYDGQPIPLKINQRALEGSTKILASPYKFKKHGQSGTDVSELLPHTAKMVDDLAVIRSMHSTRNDHDEASFILQSGRPLGGFPSLGSWLTYGLGTTNRSMPGYVVVPTADLPPAPNRFWTSGFLPPVYQGTPFNPTGVPINNLQRPGNVTAARQRQYLDLTQSLNRRHLNKRGSDQELDARISNIELADRMQVEAMKRVDLGDEPEHVKRLYGIDDKETREFGLSCLMARRLVEAGVRFVQVMKGQWDHHGKIFQNLPKSCRETDKPVAGLLADLKQRGLLDETLVFWGGEFGRLPVAEKADGRDHNPHGFTVWLAGGGVKGGTVHGATDDFGYAAVDQKVSVTDLHATMLHLLGLEHDKLSYEFEGRDETLSGVEPARVVDAVIA